MTSLRDIQLFLLDMDGTIYLGNRLFPCTKPFLQLLKDQGKRFIFLTNNSSKNRNIYVEKLRKMEIEAEPDDIFTSGEATTIYLNQTAPGAKLYLVGTSYLEDEFRQAGFALTDQNPDYVVLGFDTTLTYQKLETLCNLVRDGKPFIATHPDINCPAEHGFIPDVGSFLALIESSTGRRPDLIIGKPNRSIIDAVIDKYHVKREEIAMVGDRLYTDIKVGANAGISSVLVLSGETTLDDLKQSDVRPDYIFDDLSGISEAIR